MKKISNYEQLYISGIKNFEKQFETWGNHIQLATVYSWLLWQHLFHFLIGLLNNVYRKLPYIKATRRFPFVFISFYKAVTTNAICFSNTIFTQAQSPEISIEQLQLDQFARIKDYQRPNTVISTQILEIYPSMLSGIVRSYKRTYFNGHIKFSSLCHICYVIMAQLCWTG